MNFQMHKYFHCFLQDCSLDLPLKLIGSVYRIKHRARAPRRTSENREQLINPKQVEKTIGTDSSTTIAQLLYPMVEDLVSAAGSCLL